MARRSKQKNSLGAFLVTELPKDLTQGLVGLMASIPWWAGLVLAVGFYLGLHHLASQPRPPMDSAVQIAEGMGAWLVWALAWVGQYLLALLCLLGSVLSYRSERQRMQLVRRVTENPTADALEAITWQEFEQLVAEFFRMQGYHTEEVGGGGADGGVDLVLRRNGEKYLVQCKQWKANRVSVEIVREMFGLMTAQGATGGFVVTSGRFTRPAHAFAEGRNLALIDGPALTALLDQTYANRQYGRNTQTVPTAMASTRPSNTSAKPSIGAAARANASAATTSTPAPAVASAPRVRAAPAPVRAPSPPPSPVRREPHLEMDGLFAPPKPAAPPQPPARSPSARSTSAGPAAGAEPQCPVCSRPMLLRTARKGPQAGQPFWGCVDYPVCQGTRSRG